MIQTVPRTVSTPDWRSIILILPVALALTACSVTPQIGASHASVGVQSDVVPTGSSSPSADMRSHGSNN